MNKTRPKAFVLRRSALALACLAASHAIAAEGLRVSSDVLMSETYSDNVGLQAKGAARSEWITEVTPSVSATFKGARSYFLSRASLQSLYYGQRPADSRQSLRLSANGQLELIDNMAFVDVSAGISRQSVSSFSSQSSDYNTDGSQTEVRTVAVSPYSQWRFGNEGTAELRYRANYSDSSSSTLNERVTHAATFSVVNGKAWGRAGWGITDSYLRTEGDGLASTTAMSSMLSLYYAVTPVLRWQLSGGVESNDYGTGGARRTYNWGTGFTWAPSPRTSIAASGTRRYFGDAYDLSLTHRMRRSAFDLRYSRNVVDLSSSQSISGSAAYTARAQVLRDQLSTSLSGSQLDQAVAQLMAFEVANGLVPAQQSTFDMVSSSYALQRSLRATLTANGVRNTFVFGLSRMERETAQESGLSNVIRQGDLATYSRTREWRADASWLTRLTPITSLTTSLAYTLAEGAGNVSTGADDRRRSVQFSSGLDSRIGARSSVGLTYRYNRSTGLNPYTENAIAARFSHRF